MTAEEQAALDALMMASLRRVDGELGVTPELLVDYAQAHHQLVRGHRMSPEQMQHRGLDDAVTRPGPAVEPKDPGPLLSMRECVNRGGHVWRRGPYMGGVLGNYATHYGHCARCPATREGLLDTTDPDSRMRWHHPPGQP